MFYAVKKYQHVRSRRNFLVSVIKSEAEIFHSCCDVPRTKCARKQPVESKMFR